VHTARAQHRRIRKHLEPAIQVRDFQHGCGGEHPLQLKQRPPLLPGALSAALPHHGEAVSGALVVRYEPPISSPAPGTTAAPRRRPSDWPACATSLSLQQLFFASTATLLQPTMWPRKRSSAELPRGAVERALGQLANQLVLAQHLQHLPQLPGMLSRCAGEHQNVINVDEDCPPPTHTQNRSEILFAFFFGQAKAHDLELELAQVRGHGSLLLVIIFGADSAARSWWYPLCRSRELNTVAAWSWSAACQSAAEGTCSAP